MFIRPLGLVPLGVFFMYATLQRSTSFLYYTPYIQCRTPLMMGDFLNPVPLKNILWLWGVGIILYKQRCPSGEIDRFAYPRTLAKNISIVQELFANFLSMAKRDLRVHGTAFLHAS